MKKTMTIFGAILFASFILTSCGGNSIDSDAKKCAELQCKSQKLATEGAEKAASGDMSVVTEATKLAAELKTLEEEMKGKYKEKADLEKFRDAFKKAMGDCK